MIQESKSESLSDELCHAIVREVCGTARMVGEHSSPEDRRRSRKSCQKIYGVGAIWVDRKGEEKMLALDDILAISPYNMFDLRIACQARGLVDKFRGPVASIIIYSMTASTHGMRLGAWIDLYALNRLNVATSRVKCLPILVLAGAVLLK